MNAHTFPLPAKCGEIERERRHAAIRAQGRGDKLDRLIAMMAEHAAKLDEIRFLSQRPMDRITAGLVAPHARKARIVRRQIERVLDNPDIDASDYGSLGNWGPNGHGPRIDDMLRTVRFHAGRINLPARLDVVAAKRIAIHAAYLECE